MRIVSLLPSATEIIAEIGLADQLVGVSHECDYPEQVSKLPAVTRTIIDSSLSCAEIDRKVREQLQTDKALYHLNIELLEQLKPDLIVTQALCDVCAVAADEVEAAACALPGNPEVLNMEPMSLSEVFATMAMVGTATQTTVMAEKRIAALKARVDTVRARSRQVVERDRPRVAFLEWVDPLFNAGHWTPELVEMAGGSDCLGARHQPSHTVTAEQLMASDPDVLFVAQCGFKEPRTEQDLPLLAELPGWSELKCVQNHRLYYTDGNAYFSRPGPRLVDSLELMANTLHPSIHPLPAQLRPALQF